MTKENLSLHQKAIYFISRSTPHNLLISININISLNKDFLEKACSLFFENSPQLLKKIEDDNNDIYFTNRSCMKTLLSSIVNLDNTFSDELLLNKPMDSHLINLFFKTGKVDTKVTFLFDHVLVDKHSAHNIVNRFLFILDKTISNKILELPLLKFTSSIESHFEIKKTNAETVHSQTNIFEGAKASLIIPLSFNSDILEKFNLIKRLYGFSMHQLLASVGLNTLKEIKASESYLCTHLEDIRKKLGDEYSSDQNSLGILSASFTTVHNYKEISNDCKTIKQLSDLVKKAIINNLFLKELKHLSEILNHKSKIISLLRSDTPSICVSTLGSIKLYETSNFKITDYFNVVTTHPFCGNKYRFLILSYIFNDKLFVNILLPSPAWATNEKNIIKETFLQKLLQLQNLLIF